MKSEQVVEWTSSLVIEWTSGQVVEWIKWTSGGWGIGGLGDWKKIKPCPIKNRALLCFPDHFAGLIHCFTMFLIAGFSIVHGCRLHHGSVMRYVPEPCRSYRR